MIAVTRERYENSPSRLWRWLVRTNLCYDAYRNSFIPWVLL